MSRRSRRDKKSSDGAMADVLGAVGTFCHIESPVLTAHHTVDTAPELPPRVPVHHKTLSSPSSRKPYSHSTSRSSSGFIITGTPAAVDASPAQLRQDSLDVCIPLSSDVRPLCDGAHFTGHTGNETDTEQKISMIESVESKPTAFRNVFADNQKFSGNNAGDGLDVVVPLEYSTGDLKLEPVGSLKWEQPTVGVISAGSHDSVSGEHGRASSCRARLPNVARRLTRKETTKLSQKLTRKMSCRQQHALMMDTEFDEFDELDVVVERDADVDDEGDEQISDSDSELMTARHSDISDADFDERVTTRLHYDRLQVCLPFLFLSPPEYCGCCVCIYIYIYIYIYICIYIYMYMKQLGIRR